MLTNVIAFSLIMRKKIMMEYVPIIVAAVALVVSTIMVLDDAILTDRKKLINSLKEFKIKYTQNENDIHIKFQAIEFDEKGKKRK